jgi:hypothetical protein
MRRIRQISRWTCRHLPDFLEAKGHGSRITLPVKVYVNGTRLTGGGTGKNADAASSVADRAGVPAMDTALRQIPLSKASPRNGAGGSRGLFDSSGCGRQRQRIDAESGAAGSAVSIPAGSRHGLPWLTNVTRAVKPKRLPVVLSRAEVRSLLAQLDGTPWLVANLLYGSGPRLMEGLRLRVKDLIIDRK